MRTWITSAAYADVRLDPAIRSWSLINEAVRESCIKVDEERIAYLTKLLRAVGWSKDDALALGEWTYGARVGYATLDRDTSSEKQLSLILDLLRPR